MLDGIAMTPLAYASTPLTLSDNTHPVCGPPLHVQGDIYRPLALPALLVGDPKLGGIATTLSAYESLLLRGATVSAVIMMTENRYNNVAAVRQHLQHAAAHR